MDPRGDISKNCFATRGVGDDDAECYAMLVAPVDTDFQPNANDFRAQLLNGGFDFAVDHFTSDVAG